MKASRHLAQLVIRDLAQFSGLKFTHPDRLTRAEAAQVREWAQKQPAVTQAIRDRGHGEHAAVRLYADLVNHFAFDHPQGPAGEPMEWTEGRLLDDSAPIAGMTADEAAARLAWAETKPDYRAAYRNASHPDHATLVAQTASLHERMAAATPPSEAAAAPAAEPAEVAPKALDAQGRIAEARSDPAYLDARSPSHKQAVAAVEAAYQAAYPQRQEAPATRAPSAAPPPAQSAPVPAADPPP